MLILSMHDNEEYLFEALRAGASGYVLKSAADHDLIAACRAAVRGETFLYPRAVKALVREFLGQRRAARSAQRPRARGGQARSPRATPAGQSARNSASADKTVDRHRANVLDKLGMRDRVELTRYAIRRGLVEP